MCGRYTVSDFDDFSERVEGRQLGFGDLLPEVAAFRPTWNAAPSQRLPVVVENRQGQREVRLFQWGLRAPQTANRSNVPKPINARVETVWEKPLFRRLLTRRRCLVPATGFYEWLTVGDRKEPYAFRPTDQSIFAIAGLYDAWLDDRGEVVGSFCLLTTPPNKNVRLFHDRMPGIFQGPDEEERWISRGHDDVAAALRLVRPYPDGMIAAHAVGLTVNNPRHDGPELIAPIAGPDGRIRRR